MDSLEKNSEFGIWFTAASFALDFVLPEEYRFIEKVSYKNFLIMTTSITAIGVLRDKGKEMLYTSRSSLTLSSTLPESS